MKEGDLRSITGVDSPCLHTDKLNLLPYPRAYMNSLETSVRRLRSERQQLLQEVKDLRKVTSPQRADECPAEVTPPRRPPEPNRLDGEDSMMDGDNRPMETTPPQNAISSEVGLLTLNANGEQRYLGSSSGVMLAGIIYSLVESTNFSHNQQESSMPDDDYSRMEKAAALPDKKSAMHAINAYFSHWHLTFSLISRAEFMRMVENMYTDQVDGTSDRKALDEFFFHMVIAMGLANFNKPQWSTESSEAHYIRAISNLEDVLSMRGLAPLQAILMICQYSIFCSLKDTSANMWHLIGIAARLCVEMGLHRKSRTDDLAAQGLEGGEVELKSEMRKRTFWCFYNMDRYFDLTLRYLSCIANKESSGSLV